MKRKITNEIINKFKVFLYEDEKSENTIAKYMHDIKYFVMYLKDRNVSKESVINLVFIT